MRGFKVPLLGIALVVLLVGGAQAGGNRLANESSPYLRRASAQPVDWYPWGAAAFAEARRVKKPLLIDVGASWCSFCGLMDEQSYSRPEFASFINQNFVPVKVDYDAHPEMTRRLERAQALANLPAGIPLVMIVTPQGSLYAGGTYFPPKKTADKPGFLEMLQTAIVTFKTDPARIQKEGVDLQLEKNP